MTRRLLQISFCVLLPTGCADSFDIRHTVESSSQGLVGDAIAPLNDEEIERFAEGKEEFLERETIETGLGPIFNDKSCGACHSVGGVGGAGTQFEQRAGTLTNGVFDSLSQFGGQLFEHFSVMNLTGNERRNVPDCAIKKNGEQIPVEATVRALRRTTALFGLGLVDNTPDSTFTDLADSQSPETRGRANQVFNISAQAVTVGKFGWKAQVPTLFQFSGDAYLNEMGITNPEFPNEQAPQGIGENIEACDLITDLEDDGEDVDAFTDFMRMLAPVPPAAPTANSEAGSTLFTQIGCESCHVRTLMSGDGGDIDALKNQTYHPFSDFLLHDMGSLGDGIGDNGIAALTEMRTAPLWGLRLVDDKHQLLHDGRATSMSDAILRHDGQARTARDAFAALSSNDKNKVIAFLKTL